MPGTLHFLQANAQSPCARLTRMEDGDLPPRRVMGGGHEMASSQVDNRVLELSEVTGGVLLPALFSIGIGGYKMVTLPWPSTNGQLLLIFGMMAFAGSSLAQWRPWLAGLAAPLALYTFAVLGCLAFVLAISERSGWQVVLFACFWVLFGWHLLSRMQRLWRFAAQQRLSR